MEMRSGQVVLFQTTPGTGLKLIFAFAAIPGHRSTSRGNGQPQAAFGAYGCQNNDVKTQKAYSFVFSTLEGGIGQVTLSQKNSHQDRFVTEDSANDMVN